MMILEAKRLGFYVVVLDPVADCPAHSICDLHIGAALDDPKGYHELSKRVDVITYEWENISAETLEKLELEGHLIYPSVTALKTIQNKYSQKTALSKIGVPVPRFVSVKNSEEIQNYGKPENFGYPLMLKTTTGGYDGKGNALIQTEADVETAYNKLGGGKKELMLEEYIAFEKEISVIACRGIKGEKTVYPVAENTHSNSILDTTIVPARIDKAVSDNAVALADKVMTVFEGVGTFCIEMFVTSDGDIYVNEVAPRPHNSGHYTIEGCFANQFENHIRAIVGLPFGDTSLIAPTVMVNLIGENDGKARLQGLEEAYRDPNVHVHFYGKRESKTGRKMGHYTVVGKTVNDATHRAQELKEIIRVIGV
jgi:5-(carboxyamino)imidazole ribonucleotide synthase